MEDQLEALSNYNNISEAEIAMLTRQSKSSEAGILIEYLGPERLREHLPAFLEFLMDMNWPSAYGASKMLIASEKLILPEIKRIFHQVPDDQVWHYSILVGLVRGLPKDLIEELKMDLVYLVERGDKEGAAIEALAILKEEGLQSKIEIEAKYQFLLKTYEGNDYWIDSLNYDIKDQRKE